MRRVIHLVLACVCLASIHCQSMNSRLNYFDTDLLRYAAEDRPGNVLLSPASVKATLAMVLEGATGDTATEIRNALRLSPNKAEFREQLNLYLRMLQSNSTSGVVLQNANAVFVSEKLRLKPEYENMLKRVYMSQVCYLNLSNNPASVQEINHWVNNLTMGLIPSIVDSANIDPSTELLLTNALYFKAGWKYGFNAKRTRMGCFHLPSGCRPVAMMEVQAELNYAYVDNLRSHAVELPYEGGRYSMIVLVPQERTGLAALIRDLPYMSLPEISKLMEPADVTLAMPRFTVDYSDDMVAPLRQMRITTAFSSHANLTGMLTGDASGPQINHILHRVHLSVDEHGTVAAAATAAMVIPLIESGVQLAVDRPFIFLIRDNSVGLVLFEGKIEEPTVYSEDKNDKFTQSRRKNQRERTTG